MTLFGLLGLIGLRGPDHGNQNQIINQSSDIIMHDTVGNFPTTGEANKIYVDISDDNAKYSWSGLEYIKLGEGAIPSTIYTSGLIIDKDIKILVIENNQITETTDIFVDKTDMRMPNIIRIKNLSDQVINLKEDDETLISILQNTNFELILKSNGEWDL